MILPDKHEPARDHVAEALFAALVDEHNAQAKAYRLTASKNPALCKKAYADALDAHNLTARLLSEMHRTAAARHKFG
jgi:hypothetical protein